MWLYKSPIAESDAAAAIQAYEQGCKGGGCADVIEGRWLSDGAPRRRPSALPPPPPWVPRG